MALYRLKPGATHSGILKGDRVVYSGDDPQNNMVELTDAQYESFKDKFESGKVSAADAQAAPARALGGTTNADVIADTDPALQPADGAEAAPDKDTKVGAAAGTVDANDSAPVTTANTSAERQKAAGAATAPATTTDTKSGSGDSTKK
jgi:hypothetical protein